MIKLRLLAILLFCLPVFLLLPKYSLAVGTLKIPTNSLTSGSIDLSLTQKLSVKREFGVVDFQVVNKDGTFDRSNTIIIQDKDGKIVGKTEGTSGVLFVNEELLVGEGHTVGVENSFGASVGGEKISLDTSNIPQPITPSNNPSGTRGSSSSPSDRVIGSSGLVPCDGTKGNECTIQKILTMGVNIYNYFVGFGAILAVAAIVWGGFSYIKSQGDPSAMKEAKQIVVNAVIGIVALAASALIVNTVLNWAGKTGGVTKVEDVTENSVSK